MLWSHLHNSLWWPDIRPPSLLTFVAEDYKGTICSAMQTTRRRLSKERSEAFKSGHFDCVTDWFQVRKLWKAQPEENCPPWSAGARASEASWLGWYSGIPKLLTFGRDLKGWRPGLWNLVVVIVYILKAKWTELDSSPPARLNSLWFLLPTYFFSSSIFSHVKRIDGSECRCGFVPGLPSVFSGSRFSHRVLVSGVTSGDRKSELLPFIIKSSIKCDSALRVKK